ncbi:MAG: hypothetical protein ACRCT8_09060 [Lacipirellulaceae bacterium]
MRSLLALFLASLAFVVLAPAFAAEFRIETRVYAAGDEEPLSESVTLFSGGAAYDFRDADDRVTVFRPGVADKPGWFVLLDTERRERTRIGADKVAVAMNKLRRWAALQNDPFLRFTGDPKFEQTFDAATGELKMTSERMSYRLLTMPVASPEAMAELTAFLDAFAQLHTLIEAGVPPGPRLLVNEALAKRNIVPIEVELYNGAIDNEPSLRAEHLVTWILSKKDRERIESVSLQVSEFTEVDNATFHAASDSRLAASRD